MNSYAVEVSVPAEQAEAWLARPQAQDRLQPPWQKSDPLAGRSVIRRVEPISEGCRIVEEIEDGGSLAPVFAFRLARMKADLRRHALTKERWTVVIAGSSGFIGSRLVAFLRAGGHRVVRLVRREPIGGDEVRWDPARGQLDAGALSGAHAVINLAGPSIAKPWTPSYKKVIRQARVDVTALLARRLAELGEDVALLSASAVGIYGDGGERLLDEGSQPGSGFLAEVGKAWERAADPAREASLRVVHPRVGLVLEPGGALLGSMLPLFKAGLGGPSGSGQQWMPWVSADDVLGILHHLLRLPLQGPVNTVSPNPVRQKEFASTLGRVLSRPALAPAPAFALRALLGKERANGLVLEGQRVVPKVLEETGFTWEHRDLEPMLRLLLGR